MKKIIILISLGGFILWGLSPALSAESGRGLSLGASVGGFPAVSNWSGLRFGGEIGYQFTDRLGILFEVAYGQLSQSYESSYSDGYSSTNDSTYSSTPVSASLIFTAPLGKGFSTYVGAGLGYHSIKIKEEWTEHSPYWDESDSETEKCEGFAPHFSLGVETEIYKRVVVFGEVKHVVGKTKFEKTTEYGSHYKTDVFFGGTEVKIGLRFYFKG